MEAKIKCTDLRIGNLVKYYDDETIFEVMEIDQNGINVKNSEQKTWIEYDCFEPIPLNEEWLLKFEFDKEGDKLLKKYIKDICIYQGMSGFNYNASFYEYDNLTEIKYVHQLQNLFFALTGEELQTQACGV